MFWTGIGSCHFEYPDSELLIWAIDASIPNTERRFSTSIFFLSRSARSFLDSKCSWLSWAGFSLLLSKMHPYQFVYRAHWQHQYISFAIFFPQYLLLAYGFLHRDTGLKITVGHQIFPTWIFPAELIKSQISCVKKFPKISDSKEKKNR